MTSPERLSPDPSVALVAYRFASESKPGTYHDAALMLGEAVECPCGLWASGAHERKAEGTRIVCGLCGAVLRYWTCDCADASFRERACKHICEAVRLYAAERRAERARGTE